MGQSAIGELAPVIAAHSARLMALPGVHGVGEGRLDGRPCIVIYLSPDAAAAGIPTAIEGHAVIIERSAAFVALGRNDPA